MAGRPLVTLVFVTLALVAALLLPGCATNDDEKVEAPAPPPALPVLLGNVTDAAGAPVPGALVTAGANETRADAEGRFVIVLPNGTRQVDWHVAAAGFASRNGTQDVVPGANDLPVALARLPVVAQVQWNATITCDAVIVVGHDHGSGAPDPEEHTDCDPFTPYPQKMFPRPEGAEGLVVEVSWEPETPAATHLTAILYDDGRPLAWDEGTSPLRLQVPRDGLPESVLLHVSAGAPHEDAAVGVVYEQPFTADLHWFLWHEAPADHVG